MTIYADQDPEHDNTYYGKGCKNSWGASGSNGSITPCPDSDAGGRFVTTFDNETQKNGTYYHFQAVTSGSGAATTGANANAPDTFCPLGWQLPYTGTGGAYYDKSRSWNYLFTTYGISYNDGAEPDENMIRSYPFSYTFAGRFVWTTGRLYYQSNNGNYWSSTSIGIQTTYSLGTWSPAVRTTEQNMKAYGNNVRCDYGISNQELSMASEK